MDPDIGFKSSRRPSLCTVKTVPLPSPQETTGFSLEDETKDAQDLGTLNITDQGCGTKMKAEGLREIIYIEK